MKSFHNVSVNKSDRKSNRRCTITCHSRMKEILGGRNYVEVLHFFHSPMGGGIAILLLLISLFLRFVAALAWDLVLSISSKRNRRPPSPPRLPLLGNLYQIKKAGSFLSALTDMARSYGPVMTVWMGPSPLVILTGQTAIWEAMVNQASNFADRPKNYSRQYTSANFKTLLLSPCNERWIKLRKLLRNNVLSPFHVASQSSFHQAILSDLFNTLAKEREANDGVVRPFYTLKMMTMSFIARLCFGPHFQDQSCLVKLEELIAENISLGDEGGTVLLASFPFSRYFLPSSRRTVKKWESLRAAILQLLLPFIQFARSYRVYFKQSAGDCYLNCLVSASEEEDEDKLEFSDEEIAFNLFELFFLAIDSTSTALEWALAYLITHPYIQERAYQEVSKALEGKEGDFLCLEDLGKIPYLQAVVKETLRKESIAPLAVVHQTVDECKVMDITIPAKSTLLLNLHSVCNDPETWKEPDQFMPERFLGNMDSDKMRMSYLPFGAGRRVCAGMDLANVHVPITLANLLIKFEWACVKEGRPPDLTRDMPFFIVSMKYPLEARITCR